MKVLERQRNAASLNALNFNRSNMATKCADSSARINTIKGTINFQVEYNNESHVLERDGDKSL